MIRIQDKKNCCGCTACASICPKQCIQMIDDEEGFCYPQVVEKECIQCHLCENVCPVTKPNMVYSSVARDGFVTRSKNSKRREASSSGGFVDAALRQLIIKDYLICGAAFGNKLKVEHRFINKEEELYLLAGSKYVQSDLGHVFKEIKDYLENGGKICFVGTGCQIDGLKNYLRKEYEHLFTIGVVCHGVPSHLLWEKYLEYQEKKYNSQVAKANFRDKTLGYQTPAISLAFHSGKRYLSTGRVDFMLKSFFSHCSLRYSCFNCPSKGLNRTCDITVFDCWNSRELINSDDNRGYTAVLVHSAKGDELLHSLKDLVDCKKVAVEELIPAGGGGMVLNSAKYTERRKGFYAKVLIDGIDEVSKSVLKTKMTDYVVEWTKVIAARLGVLKAVSRYRRLMARKKRGRKAS